MNNVQLVGRVAIAPKLRTTGSGKPYMRLVLAVDGYWDKKTKQMTTDFIPVKLWQREATRCQHLMKGSLVSITGRVSVARYKQENGDTAYVTEIIGENIQFLSKPKSAKEAAG